MSTVDERITASAATTGSCSLCQIFSVHGWSVLSRKFPPDESHLQPRTRLLLATNSDHESANDRRSLTTMAVDPGDGGQVTHNLEYGTLMQIVPLRFCHIGTKRSFCGIQNTPKSVFGWGDTAGELTTLPQAPCRLGRGHPSPYLNHSAPTHLRRSPCVPPEFQPDLRLCWRTY